MSLTPFTNNHSSDYTPPIKFNSVSDAAGAPAETPALEGGSTLEPRRRKRLKPGERRVQILQTLAHILEQPNSERVTTALLAARLQVSEAALYRHFASKTQMFEAVLELVELAVSNLINETAGSAGTGRERAAQLVTRLLTFTETNPGLGRVIAGDALVFEHERLQNRLNALLKRFESTLHQCLQADGVADPALGAELLATFAIGRMHIWSRSGFTRKPTADLNACLAHLIR